MNLLKKASVVLRNLRDLNHSQKQAVLRTVLEQIDQDAIIASLAAEEAFQRELQQKRQAEAEARRDLPKREMTFEERMRNQHPQAGGHIGPVPQ